MIVLYSSSREVYLKVNVYNIVNGRPLMAAYSY